MNEEPKTFYYRYEEYPHEFGLHVQLRIFLMVRKTPKGAWITKGDVSPSQSHVNSWMLKQIRFVLDGPGKRFAHQQQEWAFKSLKRRKEMQIWKCETGLLAAKATLAALEDPDFAPAKHYPNDDFRGRFGDY